MINKIYHIPIASLEIMDNLEDLLSEADLVIHQHKVKVKLENLRPSGNCEMVYHNEEIGNLGTFDGDLAHSSNDSFKIKDILNESGLKLTSQKSIEHNSQYCKKLDDLSCTFDHDSSQNLLRNKSSFDSDLSLYFNCKGKDEDPMVELNASSGLQTHCKVSSGTPNLSSSAVINKSVNGSVSNASLALGEVSVTEELRELCWTLLSTANTALRQWTSLARQFQYSQPQQAGSSEVLGLSGDAVVEAKALQQRVASVAARVQHLLAEVCASQQRCGEHEAECGRLCALLCSLLRGVGDGLRSAGLEHLAPSTDGVSPRRQCVQREVEAACSGLQLLQEQVQRSMQLQQEQDLRVQQLQQQAREAEEREQVALDRCSSGAREREEEKRHHEQQLRQVYLQLAGAEEQLQQLHVESTAAAASQEEELQRQRSGAEQLRADLRTCQQRLQDSLDASREMKVQLDHLRTNVEERANDLQEQVDDLRQERDQLQVHCEAQDRKCSTAVREALQQRDEVLSRETVLKGEFASAEDRIKHLKSQLQERVDMQEEINNKLWEVKAHITDTNTTHEEEVKILHDKLSRLGLALCDCQQQLRREQLRGLQQNTLLEIEKQRVDELKQHNAMLHVQMEQLNKSLQDQLNKHVAKDVADAFNFFSAPSVSEHSPLPISHHNECAGTAAHVSAPSVSADTARVGQHARSQSCGGERRELETRLRDAHSSPSLYHCASGGAEIPGTADLTSQIMRLRTIEKTMLEYVSECRTVEARDNIVKGEGKEDCEESGRDGDMCVSTASLKPVDLSVVSSCRNAVGSPSVSPVDLSRHFASSELGTSVRYGLNRTRLNSVTDTSHCAPPGLTCRRYSLLGHILKNGRDPVRDTGSARCLYSPSTRACSSLVSPDSGISSFVPSSSNREQTSQLRKARQEARMEKLESTKLRERCKLLQLEVNMHKTALEDELNLSRMKSRLYRIKRDEFGQLLGGLEDSVGESGSVCGNPVNDCSNNNGDTSSSDLHHLHEREFLDTTTGSSSNRVCIAGTSGATNSRAVDSGSFNDGVAAAAGTAVA